MRRRLRARVYGGGTMLAGLSRPNDLGHRNADAAFEILEQLRIPVVEQDVRGDFGRRIVFETASGRATVRRIA